MDEARQRTVSKQGSLESGIDEGREVLGDAVVDERNRIGKGKLECGLGIDEGDELVNVKGFELLGCEEAGAGEDNEGPGMAVGEGGDAADELAREGLGIHTAFAGDDEIDLADVVFEVGNAGDELRAGMDLCRHEQGEHGGEASGGASAGEVYRPIELCLDDVVQVAKAAIENADHFGGSALLGTEYGGCTMGAEERVVYIAEERALEVADCGRYVRQIDVMDKTKVLSDRVQQLALLAVEASAERGGHAYASIVRGGTTDAEDERGDVVVSDGIVYYIAGASG